MLPEPGGTREQFSETLHISFSALTTYLTCPRRYRYHYVEGQPWELHPAALLFGGAIHRAVAWFYGQLKEAKQKPQLDELRGMFHRYWDQEVDGVPVRYKEGESLEILRAKGDELLAVFLDEREAQTIEAVEYPFSVELMDPETGEVSDYRLVGVFDLIESDDRQNLIISELKTAARRQDEDAIRYNLQAAVYSYALKQLGFSTTNRQTLVRFDVLIKTKKPSLQPVFLTKDDDDHRRVINLIREVLRATELGIFYPNYGWWCNDCPFQKRCNKDL